MGRILEGPDAIRHGIQGFLRGRGKDRGGNEGTKRKQRVSPGARCALTVPFFLTF